MSEEIFGRFMLLTAVLWRLARVVSWVIGSLVVETLIAGVCFAHDTAIPGLAISNQASLSKCALPANADVRRLEWGASIEQELGGGQTHSYAITVTAKQFVRVIVDQRGIDLAAILCTADGNQVARVDRPNGATGAEAISIVPAQSGILILQVKSLEKTAAIAPYQVRIAEQRETRVGDETRIEAELAISEGEVLRARGKPDNLRKAVEKFELARTLWRTLDDQYEEALALYGLGWSHSESGAHEMVKFPIPVHRLRWSYESRGEHERSIESFKSSLAIMTRLGDSYGQAIVNAGLGWPQMYLEQNEEALWSFERAYELFRNASNVRGQAIVLYGIGWVHSIRGEEQEALESFLASLSHRRAYRDLKGEAITLAGISRVLHRLGRNHEAADYAERALAIFQQLHDAHGQASTISTLGWINHSLGRQEALGFFETALSMRREANDSTGAANSLYGIARVHDQQQNLTAALKRMREVLEIIEPLRGKGGSSDLRTYYFANVQEYYEFYVDLLMRLDMLNPTGNYAEAAVAAHERSRAREMLAILAQAGDIRASTGQDLSRPLEADEIKRLLDDDTLMLEYELGEEQSYVWSVSNKKVRGHKLPKRAEIEARAKKLYDLLTARNQQKSDENEAQRETRIKQADAQAVKVAAALSRTLLGPVVSELSTKRLVVVAEGALQLIPFGVLPVPSPSNRTKGRPLLIDHEIVNLPSASVLSALRREVEHRTPASKMLAVFADPVFSPDDLRVRDTSGRQRMETTEVPESDRSTATRSLWNSYDALADVGSVRITRLLGTRWEGQQIASLVPDSDRLLALDFSATRHRALSGELGEYRVIHFATHAFINDVDPVASAILLSRVDAQGRSQDGSLTLHDIYQLKLGADLVVLSACRTGLGSDIKGEGMRGLAGGFMQAKVPRIVVSLWPVSDRVTAEFMVRFYRRMLRVPGKPAAAALREVQTEMLKDARWQSAYFWAPFVLQGEWR